MKDASREALTTLTNLPHCGKVVFTKVGCDRFNGKPSRVAPAPAVSSMLAPIVNHHYDRLTTRKAIFLGTAASLICASATRANDIPWSNRAQKSPVSL
jgi:hypothetical protein